MARRMPRWRWLGKRKTMTKDFKKKLKSQWETFTPSEQRIASYLLHNISGIPFETASSLGKRVGVSAMTVGRFLRNLGYDGFGDLKEELRGETSWKQLYKIAEPPANADYVSEALRAEIRSLNDVYALARSEEWMPIVKLLIAADRVSVASFQHGAFLGMGFASSLQHVRPRVSFDSGADGSYTGTLLDSTGKSCVVLIDIRRYSRHFRLLAEEVVERGIPLVIITDTQCYWARQLTPHVLTIAMQTGRAWHSFGTLTSLFSLLINAVIREMGDVFGRIGGINELRQKFIGYDGPSLSGESKPDKQAGRTKPRGKKRKSTPRNP
jgi:DNA-binding MurR/RpiR family transcriptional regulator